MKAGVLGTAALAVAQLISRIVPHNSSRAIRVLATWCILVMNKRFTTKIRKIVNSSIYFKTLYLNNMILTYYIPDALEKEAQY